MGTTLHVCDNDQDEYDGEVLGNLYAAGQGKGYGFAWNIKPETLDEFVGCRRVKGGQHDYSLEEFRAFLKEKVSRYDYDCIGLVA